MFAEVTAAETAAIKHVGGAPGADSATTTHAVGVQYVDLGAPGATLTLAVGETFEFAPIVSMALCGANPQTRLDANFNADMMPGITYAHSQMTWLGSYGMVWYGMVEVCEGARGLYVLCQVKYI